MVRVCASIHIIFQNQYKLHRLYQLVGRKRSTCVGATRSCRGAKGRAWLSPSRSWLGASPWSSRLRRRGGSSPIKTSAWASWAGRGSCPAEAWARSRRCSKSEGHVLFIQKKKNYVQSRQLRCYSHFRTAYDGIALGRLVLDGLSRALSFSLVFSNFTFN